MMTNYLIISEPIQYTVHLHVNIQTKKKEERKIHLQIKCGITIDHAPDANVNFNVISVWQYLIYNKVYVTSNIVSCI